MTEFHALLIYIGLAGLCSVGGAWFNAYMILRVLGRIERKLNAIPCMVDEKPLA